MTRFISLCLCVCVLLVAGCVQRSSPVPPGPRPEPEVSIATRVFGDYRSRYADAVDVVAGRLEQGQIKEAQDFSDQMQEALKAARLEAFEPFSSQVNDAVGDDLWEPIKAAAVLRKIADEVRKGN